MSRITHLAAILITATMVFGQTKKAEKTDAQINQEIIKQSIEGYKGSCPCRTASTGPVGCADNGARTVGRAARRRFVTRGM